MSGVSKAPRGVSVDYIALHWPFRTALSTCRFYWNNARACHNQIYDGVSHLHMERTEMRAKPGGT